MAQSPTNPTRPAFRTGADLALAADHYIALAKMARSSEEEADYLDKARKATRLMWETTARENGWS